MSRWLCEKYLGKYRILAPIDNETHDFARELNGKWETNDFYIPCEYGEITHYGRSILEAFLPYIKTGKRIIRECEEAGIKVTDVKEGDGEISFRFNAKDIDFIAKKMGARVRGKDIRPFSSRNLPKSSYVISREKMEVYKEIMASISKEDKLVINKITKRFIQNEIASKYGLDSVKAEIKQKHMARQLKEYIDSIGEWDNYIRYLKQELNKISNKAQD